MDDVYVRLADKPGALADFGEAVGRAGLSIEGGGVFSEGGMGCAHFLFVDGAAARKVLEQSGIDVVEVNEVLVQRLDQERPGQLGAISRAMAAAGVNIRTMYSDHDNQLILVVDDVEAGRRVSENWCGQKGR